VLVVPERDAGDRPIVGPFTKIGPARVSLTGATQADTPSPLRGQPPDPGATPTSRTRARQASPLQAQQPGSAATQRP
jgi:hypothetical protein